MNTELFASAFRWLHDSPRHRSGVRILQVAIGFLLLFRTATEARFASYFWGPEGIGRSSDIGPAGPLLRTSLRLAFSSDASTYALLACIGLASVCLILGRATRVATAVALLGALLLEHRLPELLDGGDNITRLCLGYLLFVLPPKANPKSGSLSIWVHNVAILAVMIQVCIMYTTAGFMKAQGPKWVSGTALYSVSQIEWFSLPSTRFLFKNPAIVTLSAYATIFFQLWFPMAIFSRLRFVWVIVGIGFHLGIAVTMGLVPFSMVMIGVELFMLDDADYILLKSLFEAARAWLQRGASTMFPRMAGSSSVPQLAEAGESGSSRAS